MRLGAVTLAYQDEGIIRGTLRCLKPFVERHIVLISEKPYFCELTPPDRTEEICLEEGAEVVKGSWPLDHFQRTLGNKLLNDVDWILTFDSDEMMTDADLVKFIYFLHKLQGVDAVCVKPEVYWKTVEYRLRPKPGYTPIIATRPNVSFNYIRNVDSKFVEWTGGEMHHLSWCDPKDIHKKVLCYAHAPDFDWEKWYQEKYMTWQEGTKAIFPDGEFEVIKSPLPEELKRCLNITQ